MLHHGGFFFANVTNQTYMDYCEVESLSLASLNDIVEDLDYEAAERIRMSPKGGEVKIGRAHV